MKGKGHKHKISLLVLYYYLKKLVSRIRSKTVLQNDTKTQYEVNDLNKNSHISEQGNK